MIRVERNSITHSVTDYECMTSFGRCTSGKVNRNESWAGNSVLRVFFCSGEIGIFSQSFLFTKAAGFIYEILATSGQNKGISMGLSFTFFLILCPFLIHSP